MKQYLDKLKSYNLKRLRKLNKRYIFIGVFIFIGVATLLYTRAASPTAHFEAESSTLACATTSGDAGASGGQFIQFSGTNCAGQVQTASSVTQNGITWTFSSPKTVGQFANGDWWVVGPVTINSISPNFNSTTKKNGWEVNPTDHEFQGFDGQGPDYKAALMPSLPYNATANQSIVKAISISTGCTSKTCLQTAAVLTVLGSVPPNNGATVFRPPYYGTNKPLFSTNDMDANMNILPRLTPNAAINAELPTFTTAKNWVSKVQMSHVPGFAGDFIRPIDNFAGMADPYGPDVSNATVNAFLRVLSVNAGDSEAERRQVVLALTQVGIDFWGQRAAGVGWWADGGINLGMKLAPTFAGVILNNTTIKDTIRNSPRNTFAESDQIKDKSTTKPGIPLWGQPRGPEWEYWQDLTEEASRTIEDPYRIIDGGAVPGEWYMGCCTSQALKGVALVVRLIPGMQAVWNDDSNLEYADRWVDFGTWTQPDPCAPISQGGGMNSSRPGECILDPDLTAGSTFTSYSCQAGKQCGRFPSLHGASADGGLHRSDLVDAAWPVYKNW